ATIAILCRSDQLAFAPTSKLAWRSSLDRFRAERTRHLDAHRLLLVPTLDINSLVVSIPFFSYPLPDICGTIFQPRSAGFATCQELYGAAVCQSEFSQVQHNLQRVFLQL